jgi:hypothetical protein
MKWLFNWFKALYQRWFGPQLPPPQDLFVVKTVLVPRADGKTDRVDVHLSDGTVFEPLRGFYSDQEAHNLAKAWDGRKVRRTAHGQILRMD